MLTLCVTLTASLTPKLMQCQSAAQHTTPDIASAIALQRGQRQHHHASFRLARLHSLSRAISTQHRLCAATTRTGCGGAKTATHSATARCPIGGNSGGDDCKRNGTSRLSQREFNRFTLRLMSSLSNGDSRLKVQICYIIAHPAS